VHEKNLVFVLAQGNDPQLSRLKRVPHVIGRDVASVSQAAKDATVILNWSGNRDLLRMAFLAAPRLRWVHFCAAGLDSWLFRELIESNVLLTNSRGVFSGSLAEFVVGAILFFAKDFRRMLRNQAADLWKPFDVEDVEGKVLGIVGYGDIGKAVGKQANAMGMRVFATKRHLPATDPLIQKFYTSNALKEMFARCDYIAITLPLTRETRHMIGEAEFAAMRSNAVVINVGRGQVVNEAALIDALTTHRIRGAALDVFEQEPLPAGNPLYRLDNVLLSPHCADQTPGFRDRLMLLFLEQYDRFRNGELEANLVNKELGY
jgi:phosphoglycerate dehydrogenase-like enzyme